jgi:hypothetical protein
MPKASVVLNGFIDMRRDGFFPHREYYCLLIPCLLTFNDHTGNCIVFDVDVVLFSFPFFECFFHV